ncbi:MAG TPA: glutathione S-transferase family protein [Hyphomicrobium sp.]|jgi:glutathione S-transferase|nr:glutathione S-transferase family protein [Hyphomicrobium sp.]
MKLYGFAGSPRTWKVRAVAAHLGIPLEYENLDPAKGENRTPKYLALNPAGRTPTLVDGDFVLWESDAIMQYLASKKPNTLWPDDARTRADIMRWQNWQSAHWGSDACVPLIGQNLVKAILGMGAPDAAVVAKATEAFNREAAVLDQHLAKHEWLVGSSPTLADFTVGSYLFYANEAKLPVGAYKNISRWFARLSALPGWAETAPPPRPAVAA